MKQMYQRFYPETSSEDAEKFANQLPEYKLSMAKMQGHFLDYRDSAKDCLENAKEILKSPDMFGEMTMEEWLDRLNLVHWMHVFVKNRVFTVRDLKAHVDEGGSFHDGFKFGKHDKDKQRLGLMIRNDKNAIEGFEYKTIQGCRQILGKFIKNQLIREKLVRYIKDENITGYQLQDILRDNLTYEKLRDAIITQ